MVDVHIAGEYANLKLLADELLGTKDFVGEIKLQVETLDDRPQLNSGLLAEILIHLADGAATAAGAALAKSAIDTAVKRARGRGKISRSDDEGNGSIEKSE